MVAIALLILSWIQIKTNQQISQIWDALESPPAHQRFNADMVAALPAPVQRYFLHAIAPGTPFNTVRIRFFDENLYITKTR